MSREFHLFQFKMDLKMVSCIIRAQFQGVLNDNSDHFSVVSS